MSAPRYLRGTVNGVPIDPEYPAASALRAAVSVRFVPVDSELRVAARRRRSALPLHRSTYIHPRRWPTVLFYALTTSLMAGGCSGLAAVFLLP